MTAPTPTLLLILDGWGDAPASPGNAVALAETPTLDALRAERPRTLLTCSGRAVGLPEGFMGNSEVGHMNIGAGRIVYQDMTRIDMAIERDGLAGNAALARVFEGARERGTRVHLMGLLSDGGVHSHTGHLFALLELARRHGVPTFVHVFLDGRDTAPTSGEGFMRALAARLEALGHGRVATVTGRYWAMDRDKRWERNQRAYDAMTLGLGRAVADPVAAVTTAYAAGQTDEFVEPCVVTGADGAPVALLEDGDAVLFFNFRADRARQIVRALFDPDFTGFPRQRFPRLEVTTMTRYEADFPLPVAFPPVSLDGVLGEVVSGLGLSQLRIAETEKYAHVTYFMNCGREEPFPGEERILVPSPREVATYDQKPEMSVREVTDKLCAALGEGQYPFVACNLANLDMVGHTGIIPAVCAAARAVDGCVARILDAARRAGYRVMVTADHGNAEEMLGPDGGPQTAHSRNKVPFVLVEPPRAGGLPPVRLRRDGVLGDIAPTILGLWGVALPEGMTGRSLVEEN